MRILLVVTALIMTAMPAFAAESLDATYARWERLRAPDTAMIRFDDGYRFLTAHEGWPQEKIIRMRTEAAALEERPERAVMKKFCTDTAPISGRGMIACARAEAGSANQLALWIKQGWLQGDFSDDEETRIVQSYGAFLGTGEHTERMERLLYEGKSAAAKRMLPRVAAEKRALYTARIAFINDDAQAPRLFKQLSAVQQRDTGITFDRLRWRMKRSGNDDLAELLLSAPKEVPYPDLWWPLRAAAARNAMSARNYTQALAIVSPHGDIKGEALAVALWLKGWLTLRHTGDAKAAYKHFFTLYTSVYTPVSKARAAYWAGRAADKNGNHDIANEWMGKAARYPTVFYGQLAYAWLHPKQPLPLPAMPAPTDAEKQAFAADELVVMVKQLDRNVDDTIRDLFLSAIAARANSDAQFALLAGLANRLGGTATGVDIAKLALRNGVVLLDYGWPRIGVPKNLRIEPALTLAIARQESEFNPTARSPANARGLMQLLPSTAKQTACKIDMPYSDAKLDDPVANMTLGSSYLGQIIDGFDGSYILGIASYNAGPGSVRRWLAERGAPPHTLYGAIDWIEGIPFAETRNYVMRALENVNMYRTLDNPAVPLGIEDDLRRGH
jgi:soluble lytic murein transglycosylase